MSSVFIDKRSKVRVTWTRIGVGVGIAVIGFGGVAVGGRELGWWLKADNAKRQAHVDQNSYAHQHAVRELITRDFTTIASIDTELAQQPSNANELAAQQLAIKNQICQSAQDVGENQLPEDQTRWVTDHCALGAFK